jgi:cell division septum initiation protein DivIVA
MGTEAEIRRELATERRELTQAVESLREELGHTAERGKKVGAAVGAATGALLAVRTLLRLRRRKS